MEQEEQKENETSTIVASTAADSGTHNPEPPPPPAPVDTLERQSTAVVHDDHVDHGSPVVKGLRFMMMQSSRVYIWR